MAGTPSPLTRANPRIAPDEVWARVRDDYVSGMSAAEACRRHGVGRTALHSRAAREGWRRADQAWRPPDRLDPQDEGRVLEERIGGDLDRVELRELSYVAWRRMLRAVLRGDAADALRWRRVRLAMDEDDAEVHRLLAEDEALWHVHRADADSADSTDSTDGVFAHRTG
ncbi:hypothetical protein [Brevundimonas sp.]|jgi:transposase-like protein|uniref:hypothetical protein n=1 Tax=Brevundimonas sp. TaxID=1871086 RepID=UPI002E10B793|nr:hypothetical protein [Brevundimonas sp.]